MRRSPFAFDWVAEWAERTPDAPAVGTPAGWVTYRQLNERTRSLAADLSAHGVRPGARVLIALPNLPVTVAASLAVQSLGATAVEVNRDWGASAIQRIATQVEVGHGIFHARDLELVGEVDGRARLRHIWLVQPPGASPRGGAVAEGARTTQLAEDASLDGQTADPSMVREPGAPALLVYTSGSTGTPRGVIQTHANIAANTESICEYLGLTESDRAMAILPLCYCYGKSVLQTHLWAGGSVFFDHRFMYPRVVLEAIGSQRCTGFAGVPLTFELIRRQLDPRLIPMPALRYLTQAGGAMAQDTIRWVRETFAPAQLFVMYGQTEATARLSYLPPDRADDKATSIGRPIPGVELEVVDDRGRPLAVGQEGHLVARGANVTPGYFRSPEATAEIVKDGWLWTGDLGWKDRDGFLFLAGRAKDVLKIGGHRVHPSEIELRLASHPDVVEAAVVGLADAAGVEAAVAFVVRRPHSTVSEVDLRRFCRADLPVYKVPSAVWFIDALPKTAVGKIAKHALSARTA